MAKLAFSSIFVLTKKSSDFNECVQKKWKKDCNFEPFETIGNGKYIYLRKGSAIDLAISGIETLYFISGLLEQLFLKVRAQKLLRVERYKMSCHLWFVVVDPAKKSCHFLRNVFCFMSNKITGKASANGVLTSIFEKKIMKNKTETLLKHKY